MSDSEGLSGSAAANMANGGGDADSGNLIPTVTISDQEEDKNESVPVVLAEHEAISEKASALKEHDVPEEETAEAEKIKHELDKELEENDGWLKILGNDEIMKKVWTQGSQQ